MGDVRGALGTLRHDDVAPRESWRHRFATFLALLIPVLYVNQEMVVRVIQVATSSHGR